MANDLQLFDFNSHNIRVTEIDGVAWFPAKDVCDLLGISKPSTSVKSRVDEEDQRHVLQSEISKSITMGVSFPNRGMLCVNETGVYDLVGLSRKPEARKFRKWVHGTVLPAIRKDGGYVMGEENVGDGNVDEDRLALQRGLEASERIRARIETERHRHKGQLE